MRLLGKSLPFTALCVVCRQVAGSRFEIVADSVLETQDRLRGVLAVACSKERTFCQIDVDGTGVRNDAASIWVPIDKNSVMAH